MHKSLNTFLNVTIQANKNIFLTDAFDVAKDKWLQYHEMVQRQ